MQLKTTQDICDLISQDPWMMEVLKFVKSLNLKNGCVGAGFVRNKVWDHLHGYTEKTPLADIDIIYFDPDRKNRQWDYDFEDQLNRDKPGYNWQVRNQANMHIRNNDLKPYTSVQDAMCYWVETPTGNAVYLDDNNQVKLISAYGIDDLINLTVRISPKFNRDPQIFKDRVNEKNWADIWPKLKIIY